MLEAELLDGLRVGAHPGRSGPISVCGKTTPICIDALLICSIQSGAAASAASACAEIDLSQGRLLGDKQVGVPKRCQIQQTIELFARKRGALGSSLDFDQLASMGHHHVDVGVGDRILDVREIQQRLAIDQPDADGGDRCDEWTVGKFSG